jgi:tetratricopeptide (TPR) repeat protein
VDPLKFYHGIRAIRLQGTRAERAAQHGRIIAAMKPEERVKLALTPLSRKNQFLISKAAKKLKGIGGVLSRFYDAFVLQRMLELPAHYKNRLKPFAKASKIPERVLWAALYQPDLLMVLAAMANDRVRNQLLPGMPACSTSIYQTPNDSLLFLRNLDYPAAAHWEKFPAVFYHEPSDPEIMNYVSISSLGIHTPGLTGFNEAGIAFSLHAQFSKKVTLKGAPIFFLGEDILEQARSLEEAIHLCKQFKPIGNWTLNIASFREKKAASVELSQGKIHVRLMKESENGNLIAHSNGFQCPAFQKNELHFSGSFFEDVKSRKALLEDVHPTTIIEAFNALSDHTDPETGETRVFGNTVSVVTTIQSVVIDPAQSCFYLSNRDETPTPIGPFVKLPFKWSDLPRSDEEAEKFSPSTVRSPEFMSALHAYHEAYVNWQVATNEKSGNSEVTHAYLLQATDLLPEDPHLWMQRGYFELMHYQTKAALDCFEKALDLKLSEHHRSVALYFKAACLDLLGDRANAVRHYGEVLTRPDLDSKLHKKAKNRLEKPFQRAYCQKIEPDLQFVEPLQYS